MPALTVPSGDVVASFETYTEAQRAVDRLSDAGFPVEHAQIVATTCTWSSASPGA